MLCYALGETGATDERELVNKSQHNSNAYLLSVDPLADPGLDDAPDPVTVGCQVGRQRRVVQLGCVLSGAVEAVVEVVVAQSLLKTYREVRSSWHWVYPLSAVKDAGKQATAACTQHESMTLANATSSAIRHRILSKKHNGSILMTIMHATS